MRGPFACFLLQGGSFLFGYFFLRRDFDFDLDFDLDFFVVIEFFLLGVVTGELIRIFLVLSIEHFVVVLELFGEGIINGILAIEGIAVGDDESDVPVELFLVLVLVSLDLPVDGLEIHWLLDGLVVVGNRLRDGVHWHAEGPGTFVHLQFQQKGGHDSLPLVPLLVNYNKIFFGRYRYLFFGSWSLGSL